jgi:serine/threonine protein kinase
LGLTLTGGWQVVELLNRLPSHTGGTFSVGYIVTDANGNRAFLKALDYERALQSPDPARALESLTQMYNFERDLLARCRGMDRVVTGLADGNVMVPNGTGGNQVVQYLIFEFADGGDIRKYLDLSRRFDTAWILRSIHHIATGLRQLHTEGIAHQDLKPSNVLVFDAKVSKVADLGCASTRGQVSPREDRPVAGDPEYAPPELCYGHIVPDWNNRRLGCDVFLLGGMVVFLLARGNITAMMLQELDPSLRPRAWQGTYADVLTYLRAAFERAMSTFAQDVERAVPRMAQYIVPIVRELCDPDPTLRGDPIERKPGANQFLLERYITRFDLLARREEAGILRF